MRDLNIPRWLLMILVSLTIILFTAFTIFTSIVTLKKETNGGPCKTNSDCRQDLGLLCNNYRCGCAYSHFWSDVYDICERRRMINRTCVNDSMCDILASLECENVTLEYIRIKIYFDEFFFLFFSNGEIEGQCRCKSSMTWNGVSVSVSLKRYYYELVFFFILVCVSKFI